MRPESFRSRPPEGDWDNFPDYAIEEITARGVTIQDEEEDQDELFQPPPWHREIPPDEAV